MEGHSAVPAGLQNALRHLCQLTGHDAGVQGADVHLLLVPAQKFLSPPKRLPSSSTTVQQPTGLLATCASLLPAASPLHEFAVSLQKGSPPRRVSHVQNPSPSGPKLTAWGRKVVSPTHTSVAVHNLHKLRSVGSERLADSQTAAASLTDPRNWPLTTACTW